MEYNTGRTFFSLIFLCITVSSVAEDFSSSKLPYTNVKYTLEITTKDDHFKEGAEDLMFDGKVGIKFSFEADLSKDISIELDANKKMKLTKAELKAPDESSSTGTLKDDLIVFDLKKEKAKKGDYSISVEYSTPFGNDMTGFYRSSYKSSDNNIRWLLTTHFEPIYARKAFPCFDRPDIKAKYKITIKIPKTLQNYHVLSNNPCNPEETGDFKVFTCDESPYVMSSYLVAFTVSDFKSEGEQIFTSNLGEPEKRSIKTFGRESFVKNQSGLSLTAAKDAITELSNYLGIGYAYKKIDQIGIPDFSAGAMENWGLISYREKILFFNEKTGSTPLKQSNVLTITHELVHQWFGNLVTLASWDYIWLNEAFATYFQYLIGSKIKNPNTENWRYTDQLLVNDVHLRAFETDGSVSSKPLSSQITNESLIVSYFNDITYSKGASVLRMWDLTMSDNKFQESLKDYISRKKEQSSTPDDLFESFKKKAAMEESFFKSWTIQSGYPVVQVTKKNGSYSLTQSSFSWEKADDNKTYTIPITYSTDKSSTWSTQTAKFLKDKELTIESMNESWIIINNQQAGYYRVNYEKENWIALSEQLSKNATDIHELNRAQIVNDVFSLARSLKKNYVDYGIALKLSTYLAKENSFLVWKTALNSFDFIQTKLYDDKELYGFFKNHILNLLKPHFKSLTLENLSHTEILKAIEISRWACSLNLESCLKDATNLYSSNKLNPETQEIVLCTVVRSNEKAWDAVFDLYLKESDSALKVMYLTVLGCSNNENKITMYLDKSLNLTSGIRKQDSIYVLSSVYNGNLNNIKIALEFIVKNYERIANDYGGLNPLGRALVGIAKKLNSENDIKKFKNLVEKIKSSSATAAFESADDALKIAQSNLDWSKSRKSQIRAYFHSGSSIMSYSLTLISICWALIFKL